MAPRLMEVGEDEQAVDHFVGLLADADEHAGRERNSGTPGALDGRHSQAGFLVGGTMVGHARLHEAG